MNTLARLLVNRAVAAVIVVMTLAIAVVSLQYARKVERDDDVLAFLPKGNPEVKVFYDTNKRFGGLDVALVGITAADVFAPSFLQQLREVTTELKNTRGLDHVLSLSNIVDFTADAEKGGVDTDLLVQEIPHNDAEAQALRRKVMSRDHVVGNLVAANGKAVLLYCFLAYGSDPKTTVARIQDVVNRGFPQHPKFFGGNPSISTYIYNVTQEDLGRLTPWAGLAIVVIMMLAFRDIIATCLALLSTGIGIVIALGLMSALGVHFNIVLGSMPIIMLALGSAYAIHVLARYYALAEEGDTGTAVAQTVTSIGPTVLAAGLTTVASLLSFVFMDIQPLRIFGLFTAIGLLIKLILSITFIPAVVRLGNLRRHPASSLTLRRLLARLASFARGHRLAVGGALCGLAICGAVFTSRVNVSMDQSAFFSPGSPPDQAQQFLAQHFGGSQFIQVVVNGDMTDPRVLHEVQRIGDRLALFPHVSSVLHLGQVISQINEAMSGERRIPDTAAQAKLLYGFLAGDASVAQLVTEDRSQSLIQLKLDTDQQEELETVLAAVEQWTAREVTARYAFAEPNGPRRVEVWARIQGEVEARIAAAARSYGVPLDPAATSRVKRVLAGKLPAPSSAAVEAAVGRFFSSEECPVELSPGKGPVLARTLVALGPRPSEAVIARALASELEPALVEELTPVVVGPLEQIWRAEQSATWARHLVQTAGLRLPAGDKGQRFSGVLAGALADVQPRSVMLPAQGAEARTLPVAVTGLPVMNRGLSQSVTANQIKSLFFALLLVFAIMSVLFRSLLSGLLAMTPAMFTLLVIYGTMGLLRMRLDIGTSMLGSIIVGAGVDYAIHLVAAWRVPPDGSMREAAGLAANRAGLAVWTNAVMIAAGFFILTLGRARPLINVGGMTAAAMIVAAIATFVLIPVLARRAQYRRSEALDDTAEAVASARLEDTHNGS